MKSIKIPLPLAAGILGAALLLGIGGSPRSVVRSVAKTCNGTASAVTAANIASGCFKNNGTADIFIGGADVSTTNGFPISAGEAVCDDIIDFSKAYCVTGGTSENLRALGSS